ncbi:Phosphate transport system regulatory protein PhoU [Mesoplasma florum W37]|uniref:Phosphate transport system regulatory protein PhoU n=1 Tax=Mesoplasma florum TaxID=2151 RepID=A0A2R3NXD0_MESFO|nr:phosphate signaling complex protein PhoU [Mesoplasma florum]AGY41309.1 Phosphate transport system regulatory protein PhoU [Mesoplasma florum W37]ATI73878.1 phosphate transport system regulatory protein PhoU [Mesoplasma florum]AVN58844.1 phosphate transport system regulatory protein PhoU [Mesoplasma florum]AVN59535.1 phosphate transport system regulatory protein PhoU [Mesoplasma florum]AVN64977.1 phosphate transport system regulatory protein PhoU [Mesoplasma florum]
MSINKILDNDIRQLRNMLEDMIKETKIQFAETFEVITKNNVEGAALIVEHDKIINDKLNEFTSTALWKIAKQQLVARDLRLAVGGILLAREIEIIADYSKKLCIFFSKFKPTKKYTTSIVNLFQLVIDMLDSFSELFSNFDNNLVVKVMELEAQINKEFEELYSYLVKALKKAENNEELLEISEAMKQAKNLERAGDHLLTVQEIVSFIRTGRFEETSEIYDNLKTLM